MEQKSRGSLALSGLTVRGFLFRINYSKNYQQKYIEKQLNKSISTQLNVYKRPKKFKWTAKMFIFILGGPLCFQR